MTNAICNRCEGYSNEFALQSCINCYLDTTKPNDMNQVFMKTVDNKIQPFTASYQCIDDEAQIYAFTLQDISTNRGDKKRCINVRCYVKRLHKKMKENVYLEKHDSVVQEMLNVDVELRLLKYQQDMAQLIEKSNILNC